MPRILCALICALCLWTPAIAEEITSPDQLTGEWTYAQTVSNDVYVDSITLKNGPNGLTGTMVYMDGETQKQDIFSRFELKTHGRIWFVSTRPNGRVVKHMGEFSNDGNTISGNYNLGFGVGGRFVLDRVTQDAPPSMSGKWEYHIVNPAGDDTVGDILLLGDHGGIFEEYLYYRNIDTNNKKVEGTLTKDGKLVFSIYENGEYLHLGTLDKDGIHAKGTWNNSKVGSGSFTLQKFVK